ncbi:MAG: glycerol-3-phosphate acyltransferase [Bacillota bacterium]|nr:glycerol-3-phosphate acyltransferase [Bacillota bacterium]
MLSAAVSSYLVGSFPTAHLLAKWLRKVDIRKVGVRNMGALNAYRVLGPFWGVTTFCVDAGKGALAVVLAQANGLGAQAMALCGVLAVAGHNWPVFARFRGGKGAATGIGVVVALGGDVVLWMVAIIGLLYLLTRNVSFALGVTFFALPVMYLQEGRSAEASAMALGILALIAVKMKSSIKDLQYASQGRVALVLRYLAFGVPAEKVAERRGWAGVGDTGRSETEP